MLYCCCFKQKTAYELRISDWSSDVCSSDLFDLRASHIADDSHYVRAVFGRAGKYRVQVFARSQPNITSGNARSIWDGVGSNHLTLKDGLVPAGSTSAQVAAISAAQPERLLTVVREKQGIGRSEEHTSELQSLMRISYAVFCLKKKK